MGFWRGKKLGDTLVEVTIAIGIFSLVAVAVVAVVSNSTSSAQANLENTVTREEIDAQAEAIRFIHDSYVMDTSESSVYKDIWNQIEEKAVKNLSAQALEAIENYMPTTCDAPYKFKDKNGKDYDYSNNYFVINYNALNTQDKNNIIKSNYRTPSTYPRIAYNTGGDNSLSGENNLDGAFNSAEGIFVLAVKDPTSTNTSEAGEVKKDSKYYDFYIRTCWYAANANTPSSISTIIRLTDPTDTTDHNTGTAQIVYHQTTKTVSNSQTKVDANGIFAGRAVQLKGNIFNRDDSTRGWSFANKWCWDKNELKKSNTVVVPDAAPGSNKTTTCNGEEHTALSNWTVPSSSYNNNKFHFYEMLKQNPPFSIIYDTNRDNNGGVCQYYGANGNVATSCQREGEKVNGGEAYSKKIQQNTRRGTGYNFFSGKDNTYDFTGWCSKKIGLVTNGANAKTLCENSKGRYYAGGETALQDEIDPSRDLSPYTPTSGGSLTLYAMWQRRYAEVIYDPGDTDKGTGTRVLYKEDGKGGKTITHTVKSPNDVQFYGKECFKFNGWQSSIGNTVYWGGETINLNDYQTITLTARWAFNCYYVNYYPNGGTGDVHTFRVTVGTYHPVQNNKWFKYNGMNFTGWNTNPSGGPDRKIPSMQLIGSGAWDVINLYAQWENACTLEDQHFGWIAATVPNGQQFVHYELNDDGSISKKTYTPQSNNNPWKGTGLYKWKVPEGCGGKYQLEVWGAAGGGGAEGGYASGEITLQENRVYYIYIGGQGTINQEDNPGGVNGGGDGKGHRGSGGGATHIATAKRGDGQLVNYANGYDSNVLIVAGGGGGSADNTKVNNCNENGQWIAGSTSGNGETITVGKPVDIPAPNPRNTKGGRGGGQSGEDGQTPWDNSTETTQSGGFNKAWIDSDRDTYPFGGKWCTQKENLAKTYKATRNRFDKEADACKERFLKRATGAGQTANTVGTGSWGTDHFSEYLADGNQVTKFGYIFKASDPLLENPEDNLTKPTQDEINQGAKTSSTRENHIGYNGSYGKGGREASRIAKLGADRCKTGWPNCSIDANYNTYVIWGTGSNTIYPNYFYPGTFYADAALQFMPAGGGGGYYGGGAGSYTSCVYSGAGGGSGKTAGLLNVKTKTGGGTPYGSAVIRRIGN